MKRFVFSLFLLSLFWFPLISYWNDCSGYDDLISTIETQMSSLKMKALNEYAKRSNSSVNGYSAYTESQLTQAVYNSKYWDEMRSLKSKYDKAVQDKENCLANSSSSSSNSSSSSSTSSSSSNTSYTTTSSSSSYSSSLSYNEQCRSQYWSHSYASSSTTCWCEDWYAFNSSVTYCEKITDSYCKNNLWSLFELSSDWLWCSCINWYSLDANGKNCSKITDSWCQDMLWENAVLLSTSWSDFTCWCKDWYHSMEKWFWCEVNTAAYCSEKFWNASLQSDKTCWCNDWYERNKDKTACVEVWTIECDDGYILNETQTKCVKYSIEQVDLNCKARYSPLSFVWDDWDTCECPEWYFADSDNENYCIIDRSLKSLSSRMKNTIDAQCTNDSVIKACDENPLSDSCPAVCLEMYDAITWMYDNELTIYKDPKQFWVYNEMTREQSSKFFSNFYKTVFEKPLIMPSENPFKDIDNADPTLIDYIKYSYNLWLFKGTNWKFMPFNSITKAQSLAVIIRMIAWVLDESWAKWYSEYLRRAENLNLLDNINYSLETLDNENIRRWDVALILYRLYLSL